MSPKSLWPASITASKRPQLHDSVLPPVVSAWISPRSCETCNVQCLAGAAGLESLVSQRGVTGARHALACATSIRCCYACVKLHVGPVMETSDSALQFVCPGICTGDRSVFCCVVPRRYPRRKRAFWRAAARKTVHRVCHFGAITRRFGFFRTGGAPSLRHGKCTRTRLAMDKSHCSRNKPVYSMERSKTPRPFRRGVRSALRLQVSVVPVLGNCRPDAARSGTASPWWGGGRTA